MARKKICGIYKIVFPNGKVYVGQSVDCYDRFQQHYRSSHPEKYSFKNERDINLPVHKAMGKYENIGNGYTFEILEECTKNQLDVREQYWIQKLHSDISDNGYNIASGGQETFALSRERHSQAVLTEKEVNEIKEKIAKRKQTFRTIAEEYHVSPSTITLINKGINWHDNDREYPIRKNATNDKIAMSTHKNNAIFNKREIQQIRAMRNEGSTYSYIQKYFNNRCSLSLISQICSNKIYVD
jgi:group I intron endonuclease